MSDNDFLAQVRVAANLRILFLPHAIRQMTRPMLIIKSSEVAAVVKAGIIIEDYPEDRRGHSCLMLGFGMEGRPIHVVCSPKRDYLAIITTYLPNPDQWTSDFRGRL